MSSSTQTCVRRELLASQTLPRGVRPLDLCGHLLATLLAIEQEQLNVFSLLQLLQLIGIVVQLIYQHLGRVQQAPLVPWPRLASVLAAVLVQKGPVERAAALRCALVLGSNDNEPLVIDFWAIATMHNNAELLCSIIALLVVPAAMIFDPALQLAEACSRRHPITIVEKTSFLSLFPSLLTISIELSTVTMQSITAVVFLLQLLRNLLRNRSCSAAILKDPLLVERLLLFIHQSLEQGHAIIAKNSSTDDNITTALDWTRLACANMFMLATTSSSCRKENINAPRLPFQLQGILNLAITVYTSSANTDQIHSSPSHLTNQSSVTPRKEKAAQLIWHAHWILYMICMDSAYLSLPGILEVHLSLIHVFCDLLDAISTITISTPVNNLTENESEEQTPSMENDKVDEQTVDPIVIFHLAHHPTSSLRTMLGNIIDISINLLICSSNAPSEALAVGLPLRIIHLLLWLFRRCAVKRYIIEDYDITLKCFKLLHNLARFPDGLRHITQYPPSLINALCERMTYAACFDVQRHTQSNNIISEEAVITVRRSNGKTPRDNKLALHKRALTLTSCLARDTQLCRYIEPYIAAYVESTQRVLSSASSSGRVERERLCLLFQSWCSLTKHAVLRSSLREHFSFAELMIVAYVSLFTRHTGNDITDREGREAWLYVLRSFQYDQTFLTMLCRSVPRKLDPQQHDKEKRWLETVHAIVTPHQELSIVPFVLNELKSTTPVRYQQSMDVLLKLSDNLSLAAFFARHSGLERVLQHMDDKQQRSKALRIVGRVCAHASAVGIGRTLCDIASAVLHHLLPTSSAKSTTSVVSIVAELEHSVSRYPELLIKCVNEFYYLRDSVNITAPVLLISAVNTALICSMTRTDTRALVSALPIVIESLLEPLSTDKQDDALNAPPERVWHSFICIQYIVYTTSLRSARSSTPGMNNDNLHTISFPSKHSTDHITVYFSPGVSANPVACCRDCLAECSIPLEVLLRGSFAESLQTVIHFPDVERATLIDLNALLSLGLSIWSVFLGEDSSINAISTENAHCQMYKLAKRLLRLIVFAKKYLADNVVDCIVRFLSIFVATYRKPLGPTLPLSQNNRLHTDTSKLARGSTGSSTPFVSSPTVHSHYIQDGNFSNTCPPTVLNDTRAPNTSSLQHAVPGPSVPDGTSQALTISVSDDIMVNFLCMQIIALLHTEEFCHLLDDFRESILTSIEQPTTNNISFAQVMHQVTKHLVTRLSNITSLPYFDDVWQDAAPVIAEWLHTYFVPCL